MAAGLLKLKAEVMKPLSHTCVWCGPLPRVLHSALILDSIAENVSTTSRIKKAQCESIETTIRNWSLFYRSGIQRMGNEPLMSWYCFE